MTDDQDCPKDFRTPSARGDAAAAERRVDAAVRRMARLIGRQMAREDFACRRAANDNRPPLRRLRRD